MLTRAGRLPDAKDDIARPLLMCFFPASYQINRTQARRHLDHGVDVVSGKLPADDVVSCANLHLQLLRGLAKEQLRLQVHHSGHIAPWQQCLYWKNKVIPTGPTTFSACL